jgi:hypothetical protein
MHQTRYEPCTKPEPQAKSSWWNRKEIEELTSQKTVEETKKKKIKLAAKSKTDRLASNFLLGLSKIRKRRICREPAPLDNPSDSDRL